MGSESVEKEVSVEKKLEAKIWSTERVTLHARSFHNFKNNCAAGRRELLHSPSIIQCDYVECDGKGLDQMD